MKHSVKLGAVKGVPVGAHWSLLLIMVLVTWSMGPVLSAMSEGVSLPVAYLVAAAMAALFMGSVLAHELGHVMVALRNGVPVRRVTLWALGGMAEMEGPMPSPGAAFRIAVAGPAMSVVCAVVFLAAAAGSFAVVGASVVTTALMWLGVVNVIVAVFNLLPGAPLDGGHVVASVAWKVSSSRARGDLVAAYAGLALGYLMVGWGLWRMFAGEFGLWTVLIGVFLASQARAQVSMARLELAATGRTVADVMAPLARPVLGAVTVSGLRAMGAAESFVPVLSSSGAVSGVVSPWAVRRVSPSRDAEVPIEALAQPLGSPQVPASLALSELLDGDRFSLLSAADRLVPVVDADGAVIGVVDPGRLGRLAGR